MKVIFWNCRGLGSHKDFRQWVETNALIPMTPNGPVHTWCNNRRGSARTWETLDRLFSDYNWNDLFPNAEAKVLPRGISDHAPIYLNTNLESPSGRKPFRFERMWFQYPQLYQIVQNRWRNEDHASPMGRLHAKLVSLQGPLRRWNRLVEGDITRQVELANERVQQLLVEEQQDNTSHDYSESISEAVNHLTHLQRNLEIFWAQRARVNWIQEGDRNTRFFHNQVKSRRATNRISCIKTTEGVTLKKQKDIQSYVPECTSDAKLTWVWEETMRYIRNGRETIRHVFAECDFAAECWSYIPLDLCPPPQVWAASSWAEVLTIYSQGRKPESLLKQIMILILLWNIWAARNEVVFSKRQSSASIVAARAIAHTKECCSQLARIEDKGVIRSRHNDIGFGVQNMNRVITQNRTIIRVALGIPMRMEMVAIRMAVEFARDIGLSHIWVIIDALNRGGSGPPQFQSEFERIHACSRPDDPIYFCKVERDHVRAPEVLAWTARQIQQTIYTVHLQDDVFAG
ncbi:hypothetical protein QJS10_CPB11g01494 [Acorus calamus]|uniref:Endonuclease/exonuclease/phosphatase domain-containing protein n=1 Tax=Acorus calamus TaxID=4465 RepID=A0AAV9DSG9_ACOCL|nr:hypothetical protein QJS10_CPB11g01494 [Acorus calamus]